MGPLLGKPKKEMPAARPAAAEVTSKDRATLDLKVARDKLKKYQKRLEKDSQKLLDQAKQLVAAGQKDRALTLLKLKRFKEKEVSDIDSQLVTVLEMIETVEWESHNLEILKALKGGTAALNAIHKEMSVDDVERLLEESAEAIEMQSQIDNLIAGQFNAEDNLELSAELEELMSGSVQAKATTQISLPAVPTHQVHVFPEIPTGVTNSAEVDAKFSEDANNATRAVPA